MPVAPGTSGGGGGGGTETFRGGAHGRNWLAAAENDSPIAGQQIDGAALAALEAEVVAAGSKLPGNVDRIAAALPGICGYPAGQGDDKDPYTPWRCGRDYGAIELHQTETTSRSVLQGACASERAVVPCVRGVWWVVGGAWWARSK